MNWQEVCEHPALVDLPFKIELDEEGRITMSPVKVVHSALQGEIEYLLRSLLDAGKTLPECAIATPKGTKVADVVWASDAIFAQIKDEIECSIAPEICIEVLSASNSGKEMEIKRTLYFAQGAKECWMCNEDGSLQFFNEQGQIVHSLLVPGFPDVLKL